MPRESSERRHEPRFSIGAQAVLRRPEGSQSYPAVTLNISSGGVLLRLTEANPFSLGDQVFCEIALPESPDEPFAAWGTGQVVRISHADAAIELKAGIFSAR